MGILLAVSFCFTQDVTKVAPEPIERIAEETCISGRPFSRSRSWTSEWAIDRAYGYGQSVHEDKILKRFIPRANILAISSLRLCSRRYCLKKPWRRDNILLRNYSTRIWDLIRLILNYTRFAFLQHKSRAFVGCKKVCLKMPSFIKSQSWRASNLTMAILPIKSMCTTPTSLSISWFTKSA